MNGAFVNGYGGITNAGWTNRSNVDGQTSVFILHNGGIDMGWHVVFDFNNYNKWQILVILYLC